MLRLRLLLILVALCPGCVTTVMWQGVNGMAPDAPGGNEEVHSARLEGELLEVELCSGGRYRVELGPPIASQDGWLSALETQAHSLSSGDLAVEARFDLKPGLRTRGTVLLWRSVGSGWVEACLRGPGREPTYFRIRGPRSSPLGLKALAVFGAILVTPLTFGFDLATFPIQFTIAWIEFWSGFPPI